MKYKGLRRGKVAKKPRNDLHSMGKEKGKTADYFSLDKNGINCYSVTIVLCFPRGDPVYYEISTT